MSIETFEVKEEHLTLLQAANVQWNNAETGAPEIDPKRPYGNSDVVADVIEILDLGVKPCPHCGEALDADGTRVDALQLHHETLTALRIVLWTRSFVCGTYQSKDNGWTWERV